ncbi:MAG: EAL domain-containing protein [Motiliproteus sp.]
MDESCKLSAGSKYSNIIRVLSLSHNKALVERVNNGHKTTFQSRLLTGFLLMILLVGALLFISNGIIRDASERLADIHRTQVKPLAEVNELQSKINRVRVTEIYLPLMGDYFALAAEIDRLHTLIADFDQSFDRFKDHTKSIYPLEIKSINNSWKRLRGNLQKVAEAASLSQLDDARRISTYESSPRFVSLSRTLDGLAQKIKIESDSVYQQALSSLEKKRRQFLIISVMAVLSGIGLLLLFSRSLSVRVGYLRRAFNRIAEGDMDETLEIKGNDELAELAAAFAVMKEKVRSREQALNLARDELEVRVQHRTQALHDTNQQLSAEVEERRKAEQNLRILSQAVSQSPVSIIITDNTGSIEYVNQAFTTITGYSSEEVKGNTPRMLSSGKTAFATYQQLWTTILAGGEWEGEICNRKKSGELHWEYTHISPVKDENDVITHFLSIKQDVTEKKAQQEKILYQAQYDSLTDLPNRMLALDRLESTIRQSRRNNIKAILMFIDLDGFKHINDSLGHDVGDVLLIQAARRLRDSVRAVDTVARHGGDEFLVIMGGIEDRDDGLPVVENLLSAFADPFKIAGNDLVVTASIGLALYPDDGEDANVMLRNADMAMYQAKDNGRNTFHFYNPSIHEHLSKRLELEKYLRHAISKQELSLAYQPIIDMDGERVVAVEALLRWSCGALGEVSPVQFIPLAEQTGLIIEIGNWVIENACQQLKQWHNMGYPHLSVSVNISPRQIQGEDLHQTILQHLHTNELAAEQLILEMTEGMLIRNPAEARRILISLKDLGVQLAMDDFGTGYSSLSNLKNYPFDLLKIDREFVFDIEDDPADRAMVLAAINMGKGLGLKTIAEGVETQRQLDLLRDMGCDRVQGYFHSKPLKAEQLQSWLERNSVIE